MSFHDLADMPSDIQNRIISYLGVHPVAKILNEEIDKVCCGVNEYGEYSQGNIVIFEVDEILINVECDHSLVVKLLLAMQGMRVQFPLVAPALKRNKLSVSYKRRFCSKTSNTT